MIVYFKLITEFYTKLKPYVNIKKQSIFINRRKSLIFYFHMIILWLKVPSMLIYTNMENVYDQSFSEN